MSRVKKSTTFKLDVPTSNLIGTTMACSEGGISYKSSTKLLSSTIIHPKPSV